MFVWQNYNSQFWVCTVKKSSAKQTINTWYCLGNEQTYYEFFQRQMDVFL